MAEAAICVEHLSKRYRIGRAQQRHDTLRDALMAAIRGAFDRLRWNGHGAASSHPTIWALRDVSFTVERGEVVGIIGPNGAGKTTLLKILSRITEPTAGRALIRGRVGSLLEVGAGFHPELSGRENIYLNGAVLGMTRGEIERKLDAIISFSELETFIDTPVKRYSSGMYVRLAFAVAAHLEPQVLLVDEVLAVGDAAFQRKCLGKMGQVATSGRTVLFVSHNLAAVAKLCQRALLLDDGALVAQGRADEVIAAYTQSINAERRSTPCSVDQRRLREHQADDTAQFRIETIELLDAHRRPLEGLTTGDDLVIRVVYHAARAFVAPAFMVSIRDRYDVEISRLSTMPLSGYFIESLEGDGAIELHIRGLPLTGGRYKLSLGVSRPHVEWIVKLEDIVHFDVCPSDVYQSGVGLDNSRGVVALDHTWRLL